MADRKPFVGAIVHRHSTFGCEAAIVTRVYLEAPGVVDLNGFGPTGCVPFVRLPQSPDRGAWHWPEEES